MKQSVLTLHLSSPGKVPNGCQIYRTNIPMNELENHGWRVSWDFFSNYEEIYHNHGLVGLTKLLQQFDIIVLPRACAPTDDHMRSTVSLLALLRHLGKHVVYEVDDDFTNEHRDLRNMGIDRAMEVASLCDAITVTTPFLADLMRKRTGRPVYILPNCLDGSVWKIPAKERTGPLRIGLSGSKTHEKDWEVLKEVLPGILQEEDVELVLAAYHPEYLQGLPKTLYIGGMDYIHYSRFVRSCDVILAPVDPTDGFNLGKSPIKAVEGMGAARRIHGRIGGAAVIATDTPVYRLAVEHGKTGLLTAHTPEGWDHALRSLIANTDLTQRLQLAGFQSVWKRFDIAKQWRLWAAAYKRIASKPVNQVKLV